MKDYTQVKQLSWLSLFMVYVALAFYPCLALSVQETERSTIPAINISDDTRRVEDIVLGYTEKLHDIRDAEGGVSLLLYRDRYVIVYYPAYMRRAGTYAMFLDVEVMSRLWSLLVSADTLVFDEAAMRGHIQALKRAKVKTGASLSRAGDNATTVLEIYPNRYESTEFGSGDANAMKQISWHNLQWKANEYPDIQEIQNLAMIRQALYEIMQHPNLERIK